MVRTADDNLGIPADDLIFGKVTISHKMRVEDLRASAWFHEQLEKRLNDTKHR
jgi:hypothetical protein